MPVPEWAIIRRQQLGHRLGDARRELALSQDQLATKVGVERRTIQRYESGERDPRYTDLLLLADALGVSLADLVSE